MEAAVLEAKASIHRVCCELQGFLPDLQSLKPLGITLTLHHTLDLSSTLHKAPQHPRQNALGLGAIWQVRLGQKLCLASQLSHLLLVWTLHCGEADIVLLNNGRVQTVEIEHHDELVVKSNFRIQHQAPRVSSFSTTCTHCRCSVLFPMPFSIVQTCTARTSIKLCTTLSGQGTLFIRKHELPPVEFMAQEHFVSFSTLVLQGHVPCVASEICQLFGER
mmetsp:Transcript_74540/g.129263  ORF Transcript_74540/g.129263 Transcript_74540/m.129263 type:complete len:219 (-) Transcript_74540:2418-3074(-)